MLAVLACKIYLRPFCRRSISCFKNSISCCISCRYEEFVTL